MRGMSTRKGMKRNVKRFFALVALWFIAAYIFGCAGAMTQIKTDKDKYVKGPTTGSEKPKEAIKIQSKQAELDAKLAIVNKMAEAANSNDTTNFDFWFSKLQELQSMSQSSEYGFYGYGYDYDGRRHGNSWLQQPQIQQVGSYYPENNDCSPYSCAIRNTSYDSAEIRNDSTGKTTPIIGKGDFILQLPMEHYTIFWHKDGKIVKEERMVFPRSRGTGMLEYINYDIVIIQ